MPDLLELRSWTVTQQVGLLFVTLFGLMIRAW